uniref:Uncharacterized protein n=1 Tax=Rhizophora mucronata TaxID=61149 RepID=A0A2P2Q458_RHIMU
MFMTLHIFGYENVTRSCKWFQNTKNFAHKSIEALKMNQLFFNTSLS